MSKLTVVVSGNADTRTNKAAELYGKDRENTRITTILADARAFLDDDKNVIMIATPEEANGLEEMAAVHVDLTQHEIVQQNFDA